MLRDIRKNKFFNRRALIVGSIHAFLAGSLISRLAYLQLFKYRDYSTQSDSNRIKTIMIPAPRGNILDRNGQSLTENDNNYRLLLYNDHKRNIDDLMSKLIRILDLKDERQAIFLNRIQRIGKKNIISLIDNLGWDDLARIESNYHNLPGISIESGVIRRYKYPKSTAHFLGYVSLPSEDEVKESKQALYMHPDFRLGKSGIEKYYDDYLRGKYGVKYMEVNAKDIPIRTLSENAPIQGSEIDLTIDIGLQNYIHEIVSDVTSSIVVVDCNNGEVLAYVSSPSFDINNFVEGVSLEYWQEINEDPRRPLNNRPISAIYPPGSTFKLMVALAALEEGLDPKDIYNCKGSYASGKRKFHCWKKTGHGLLNLEQAIQHSCNVYFFEIANKIGYEKIADVARRFGYGKKTNIDIQGEITGNLPDYQWKESIFNESWVGGDTLNAAIGQGFLLATPMQMACATAAIANGGKIIKPFLAKNRAKQNISSINIDQEYIDFVKKAMVKVVNEKGGTAYYQRIEDINFKIAGKTGTSQVVSRIEDERENQSRYDNHAIFVGYAPANDPKYAISVVVEHGGSGSAVAAPLAMKVMKYISDNFTGKISIS